MGIAVRNACAARMYALSAAITAGFAMSAGIGIGGIENGRGGSLQQSPGISGREGGAGGASESGDGSVGSDGAGTARQMAMRSSMLRVDERGQASFPDVMHPQRVLAAAILFGAVCSGCSKPAEAYVECKSAGATLAAGFSCTVEHREGAKPVNACWSLNIACANGVKGSAKSCGDAAPRAKSSMMMPFSAFGGALDKCDQVASANVSDLVLKEH